MEVHLVRADIVAVGSLSAELAAVARDYERRLSRYVRLSVHEVRAEPVQRGGDVVHRAEEARLLAVIDRIDQQGAERPHIVVLDSRGQQLDTPALAERWLGVRQLCLVLGGTLGLPDGVRRRADAAVAFGRITLPHQLARVVATEQLYRAFRIARGEPYHF